MIRVRIGAVKGGYSSEYRTSTHLVISQSLFLRFHYKSEGLLDPNPHHHSVGKQVRLGGHGCVWSFCGISDVSVVSGASSFRGGNWVFSKYLVDSSAVHQQSEDAIGNTAVVVYASVIVVTTQEVIDVVRAVVEPVTRVTGISEAVWLVHVSGVVSAGCRLGVRTRVLQGRPGPQ